MRALRRSARNGGNESLAQEAQGTGEMKALRQKRKELGAKW